MESNEQDIKIKTDIDNFRDRVLEEFFERTPTAKELHYVKSIHDFDGGRYPKKTYVRYKDVQLGFIELVVVGAEHQMRWITDCKKVERIDTISRIANSVRRTK